MTGVTQNELLKRALELARPWRAALDAFPGKRLLWVVMCLTVIGVVEVKTRPVVITPVRPPPALHEAMPATPPVPEAAPLRVRKAPAPVASTMTMVEAEPPSEILNASIQKHSWLAKVTGLFSGKALEVFDQTSVVNWADATKVMSLLKYYQSAEVIFLQEEGRFAGVKELIAHRGGIHKELDRAWDGQERPTPMQGYLFSEIDTDEGGRVLNREERAALCAYPINPAASRPVIIMMLDVRTDDLWNFYRADSTEAPGAVHRWPRAYELGTTFVKLKKRSPEEAVTESKALTAWAFSAISGFG